MNMFDSGIFASFIPQILMVVAYISFLLAPNFKTDKSISPKVIINENIIKTQKDLNTQVTIHFFDTETISHEIEATKTLIPVQITKLNLLYYFVYYNQIHKQTLFNRPPPLYS